ncbi:hypothetical protein PRSY57_0518000 [Plasmodium reichenowi]|uniref:Uncharacterized protein n=1 Tax=Plasmodium reichenowi TaxID=5854 RepID=A0A151LQW1_PLARE|nr:hypothetical protein PRSY57_0518000 [Plasmodium reichenowi]KYO01590.1 hypothetical protein PRSY57_0518000 [Plasmodium reichenowi]
MNSNPTTEMTTTKKEHSQDNMYEIMNKSDQNNNSSFSNTSEKSQIEEIKLCNSGIFNEDKEKQYNDFLKSYNAEYSVEQMKNFLKNGITENGVRILTTDKCSWLYDYYRITKTSDPCVKELTGNTTVDYYYYTTPFSTQIGNINLVMMHSQVNFGDGTCAPADRFFKMNSTTPEMIKEAKLKAKNFQYECMQYI